MAASVIPITQVMFAERNVITLRKQCRRITTPFPLTAGVWHVLPPVQTVYLPAILSVTTLPADAFLSPNHSFSTWYHGRRSKGNFCQRAVAATPPFCLNLHLIYFTCFHSFFFFIRSLSFILFFLFLLLFHLSFSFHYIVYASFFNFFIYSFVHCFFFCS